MVTIVTALVTVLLERNWSGVEGKLERSWSRVKKKLGKNLRRSRRGACKKLERSRRKELGSSQVKLRRSQSGNWGEAEKGPKGSQEKETERSH